MAGKPGEQHREELPFVSPCVGNERIEALGHKEDSTTPELGLACCRGELRSLIKFFCEPCFMPEERVKPGIPEVEVVSG